MYFVFKNTRIAKAVHEFNGEDPSELHFKVGEIIQVIREIDNDWCEGMIDDRSGIFPTSFVEIQPLQRKGTPQLYIFIVLVCTQVLSNTLNFKSQEITFLKSLYS